MLEFSLLYEEEKNELNCNIIKAKVLSFYPWTNAYNDIYFYNENCIRLHVC